MTQRPGLVRSPAVVHEPFRLLQVEIAPDGKITEISLRPEERTTFNTNIAPAIRLTDAFYLVQGPSLGRPFYQLQKVDGDWIKSIPPGESGAILRSIGYTGGRGIDEFAELDRVSRRNGWRRLNGPSYRFRRLSDSVGPDRHRLRLRFVEEHAREAIVAESFAKENRWVKSPLAVDTRQWWSYRRPMLSSRSKP
jgi:hypothetical protein